MSRCIKENSGDALCLLNPSCEFAQSQQHTFIAASTDGDTVGEAAGACPVSHREKWLLRGAAAEQSTENNVHTKNRFVTILRALGCFALI